MYLDVTTMRAIGYTMLGLAALTLLVLYKLEGKREETPNGERELSPVRIWINPALNSNRRKR